MSGLFDLAVLIALALLGLALILSFVRLVRGPTLPDRILALDLMTTLALGFVAAIALRTGFALYVDIAIALGLVGFLATVAFARYVMQHGAAGRAQDLDPPGAEEGK